MLSVEEKDTAVRQRDWLLEDIIPTMLNKSLKELENRNETIKGFLTLNGTCINKAELNIKLPHQETAIKASIVGSVPYFLEQLQQTNNYLLLASDRVKSFKTPTNQQSTVGLLEDLYGYVNRALHALDYPNEASLFPYKVCHPKFFTPPLKQDTAIEFCIQDVFVTCNLYALDYQVKPNKTDSVVIYKDKQIVILDYIKTQTQSPILTELKASLKLVLEWCQTHKQMLLQIRT